MSESEPGSLRAIFDEFRMRNSVAWPGVCNRDYAYAAFLAGAAEAARRIHAADDREPVAEATFEEAIAEAEGIAKVRYYTPAHRRGRGGRK